MKRFNIDYNNNNLNHRGGNRKLVINSNLNLNIIFIIKY